MSEYKISNRYATSLLESAVEKNVLDAVSKDVELIKVTLEENEQLVRVLKSPVVKSNVKFAILDEIFKSKISVDTINFLRFLIEKNREDLLENITSLFLDLHDEKMGIVNVEVKTAVPFTEEQNTQLKNKLENYLNKKVRFNFKVDEKMIGGFIAKVGDTVFDASLNHQLELLKKQFLQGSATLN